MKGTDGNRIQKELPNQMVSPVRLLWLMFHKDFAKKQVQAFLDLRSFDYRGFLFSSVYDSIPFFNFLGHVLI